MWARFEDGVSVELTNEDPEGRYHPDIEWAAVPEEIQGWVDVGLTLVADVVNLNEAALRARLKMLLERRRLEESEKGVSYGGKLFKTDLASCANLNTTAKMGEIFNSAFGGGFEVKYPTHDGFTVLTLPEIYTVGLAAGMHVQACLNRESDILDLLMLAETSAELLEVYADEAGTGWPELP